MRRGSRRDVARAIRRRGHHRPAEFGDLRGEEEVAQQVGGIGDEQDHVGCPLPGDLAGERVGHDLLVRRRGGERQRFRDVPIGEQALERQARDEAQQRTRPGRSRRYYFAG